MNSIYGCITIKYPRELLNAYNIYCKPILEYECIILSHMSKLVI